MSQFAKKTEKGRLKRKSETYSRLWDRFILPPFQLLLRLPIGELFREPPFDPSDHKGTPPAYESILRKMIPCESGGSGTSTPSAIKVISCGRFTEDALRISSAPKTPYHALFTTLEKNSCGRSSRSYHGSKIEDGSEADEIASIHVLNSANLPDALEVQLGHRRRLQDS